MTKAPTVRPVWRGPAQLRKLLVPIGLLAPHPSNPRRHDLPRIKASLEALGQQKPIVVVPVGRLNPEFPTIVAGHGTTFAARELGWTHIAAIESDLADDDIDRFVLADNRSSDNAGYHDDRLATLLAGLAERNGLAGTGYDRDDLDNLLADLRKNKRDGGHGPDWVPEPPSEPVSKRGEVYELGDHRLMCGDASDEADLQALLGSSRVQMLFTDPPYGIHLDTRYSGMHKANEFGPGGNDYAPVIGDDQPFDPTPYMERFASVKEQFWWGADYYREHLPPGGSWLVWDKRGNDLGMALDDLIGSAFELVWSRQLHKREVLRILWAGHHGLSAEPDANRRVHPTQKPVALAQWFIERYTKRRRGAVLDLFAGSGPTLIAAELHGVPCLAMEIDPAYCDVIRARYEALTSD